jgi:hypothetical protein
VYPPPLPRRRIDTRQADRGHDEHRSGSCSRFLALLGSVRETSASDRAKCPPSGGSASARAPTALTIPRRRSRNDRLCCPINRQPRASGRATRERPEHRHDGQTLGLASWTDPGPYGRCRLLDGERHLGALRRATLQEVLAGVRCPARWWSARCWTLLGDRWPKTRERPLAGDERLRRGRECYERRLDARRGICWRLATPGRLCQWRIWRSSQLPRCC